MLLIPNCFIPSQFIVRQRRDPPPIWVWWFLSESGLRFQGNQVPDSLTQIKPDNFNTNLPPPISNWNLWASSKNL